MNVLGIESSCDETGASIVSDGRIMLSNAVASSLELHRNYGGVVPEIAARSHIQSIIPVIEESLAESSLDWNDIDAIAVTNGAGLGGSLLVGVATARTLAITKNKPLYAVNHVAGHVYANFITETSLNSYSLPNNQPDFPLLALIVSGGHSQLVYFENHFKYQLLGQTRDDAIGEAFDKVARIIGLPYPGGPSIAEAALLGDPNQFILPKAKMAKYDFSFSGLKTAVLRLSQELIGEDYRFPSFKLAERLNSTQKANIAASFQRVAIESVVDKALTAYNEYKPKSFVIAGGVASNLELRRQIKSRFSIDVSYTDPKLCTDNGAMIACIGYYQAKFGINLADPYSLAIQPNLVM
ncbi:MAG TPA: tRNA (adenosine(37)-N6)-threonylcarbamoyltransferase complex transferase subunit TsaD [Candidatus Dormibacteraeota bacterium]|nr:tRNA (adenosine(37)-N6)-threonylcarbamoyltransferase complex transferase subunit TsaD [Candidatus Dormibacteraeota bacterium]